MLLSLCHSDTVTWWKYEDTLKVTITILVNTFLLNITSTEYFPHFFTCPFPVLPNGTILNVFGEKKKKKEFYQSRIFSFLCFTYNYIFYIYLSIIYIDNIYTNVCMHNFRSLIVICLTFNVVLLLKIINPKILNNKIYNNRCLRTSEKHL